MPTNDESAHKFNADELQAPEWINDDLFAKVLANCEKKDSQIRIKSTKISPASMKGDHYASVMFRAQLQYQLNGVDKARSVILKTMPESEGHKKEMLGKTDIFEKEIIMYTEVIPRFEKVLRDIGDSTVLKAACLYYSLSPRKVIVFEDLVPVGYEVVRDRPLTEEEVKAAYDKLAKWHAISHKINLEEPHYFDKFYQGVFNMSALAKQDFVIRGITTFIEVLRETPSLSKYVPYFAAVESTTFQQCRASFDEYRKSPKPGAFYVLCHGDFHCKNMMFKHNKETGKFEDVMLLDYQVGYVGPIVMDLIYSKYFILDEHLRLEFPALVYRYFTTLTGTLKKIGFEGELPKLAEIHKQFMHHKHFELFLLTTFLPMWMAMKDDIDMDSVMTSEEYRRNLCKSAEYIKYLESALPRLLHLGYFED
ncbi:uncharacterized protein LOC118752358 [Rhagoletis pomonella]|uniref:uncharacterized protein LOC118752358 n=1 Tax=Rhagoletis pomonella TaxID=28610 RepID=UPI00177F2448|nr:uncharacterized protein LOC118752358 [Rhagoletis pomonella]